MPLEICKTLAKYPYEIDFDQVIQEGTWVHIGFAKVGVTPRHQLLTANFDAQGHASYQAGV